MPKLAPSHTVEKNTPPEPSSYLADPQVMQELRDAFQNVKSNASATLNDLDNWQSGHLTCAWSVVKEVRLGSLLCNAYLQEALRLTKNELQGTKAVYTIAKPYAFSQDEKDELKQRLLDLSPNELLNILRQHTH